MATPPRHFGKQDASSVFLNLVLAIAAAIVTWLITDGVEWLHSEEWIPVAVVPVAYTVLKVVQKFLMDTRPRPD